MAIKKPLCQYGGATMELQNGDSLETAAPAYPLQTYQNAGFNLYDTDNGTWITYDGSSDDICYVPNGLPLGFSVVVYQLNTGKITFTPVNDVVFESVGGLVSTGGQYSVVTLYIRENNTAVLSGGLGA